MSYATIVLHLQPDAEPGTASEDLAIRLANLFEAHLIGMATPDRTPFSLAMSTGMSADPAFQAAIERNQALAVARCDHLAARARAAGFSDLGMTIVDDGTVANLTKSSRCCDLLILTRPHDRGVSHGWSIDLLGEVLLQSVAPVLVVPPGLDARQMGEHVLIGWNGSPEAARAVAGALPVLRRARRVTLLQCDPAFDVRRTDGVEALEAPRSWLARHGIQVEAWLEPTADDPGETLLKQAGRLGADLVVMGAWGHWRWTERLLGGATRSVLQRSTLPVLMSH